MQQQFTTDSISVSSNRFYNTPFSRRKKLNIFLTIITTFAMLTYCWRISTVSVYEGKLDQFDVIPIKSLDTLVLVACHGTTKGYDMNSVDSKDTKWALLDYQTHRDMPKAFIEHIKMGVSMANTIKSSLLLFSGGQTRKKSGPKSEAYSYYSVADFYNFFGNPQVKARTFLEEYARDSYENLIFSICRFKELTGQYPKKINVISFSFKEYRFKSLHAKAIRYPESKFSYIGVDPRGSALRGSKFDLEKFVFYEKTKSVKPFEVDPYGCRTDILLKKRQERDPFKRTIPYSLSCPDLKEILSWCSVDIFNGKLPWT